MTTGDNGQQDGVRRDPPPPCPAALLIDNSTTHYIRGEDGSTILIFTPCAPTPEGLVLMTPQVRVVFSADGWNAFKREVAADGAKSNIAISRVVPPAEGSGLA